MTLQIVTKMVVDTGISKKYVRVIQHHLVLDRYIAF